MTMFMTTYRRFLLTMRNVSDKRYMENQNKHFTFKTFPRKSPVYVMSKNFVRPDRTQKAT